MTKLLIDASSLLNIIKLKGPEALEHLKGNYILTLTPYEVGNALWKEAALLKTISTDEALTLLNNLKNIYTIMRQLEPANQENVLKLAYKLKITYYDSAYIVTAAENDLTLLTDDQKLARKIDQQQKEIRRILGKKPHHASTADILTQSKPRPPQEKH